MEQPRHPEPQTPNHERADIKFTHTIVFGEGPVKPVLIPEELAEHPDWQEKWYTFTSNRTHTIDGDEIRPSSLLTTTEPNFYVIEGDSYLSSLHRIRNRTDLSEEEKDTLITQKRDNWQHQGRFALKRMGRLNALAAGAALVAGLTDEVIFSGGQTKPPWMKDTPEGWPSEGELMADIARRRFGRIYEEVYRKPIDTAMSVEAHASNSLDNQALSINERPELLSRDVTLGLLSADHHLARLALIADRFGLIDNPNDPHHRVSAQRLLEERAQTRGGKEYYEYMMQYMRDAEQNPWLQELIRGELRWTRGLVEPEYLTYWFGFVAKVEDPQALTRAISSLDSPEWHIALFEACEAVGVDYEKLIGTNLKQLYAHSPDTYNAIRTSLAQLSNAPHRKMPPE